MSNAIAYAELSRGRFSVVLILGGIGEHLQGQISRGKNT